jgi:hypothetical protein
LTSSRELWVNLHQFKGALRIFSDSTAPWHATARGISVTKRAFPKLVVWSLQQIMGPSRRWPVLLSSSANSQPGKKYLDKPWAGLYRCSPLIVHTQLVTNLCRVAESSVQRRGPSTSATHVRLCALDSDRQAIHIRSTYSVGRSHLANCREAAVPEATGAK